MENWRSIKGQAGLCKNISGHLTTIHATEFIFNKQTTLAGSCISKSVCRKVGEWSQEGQKETSRGVEID